MKGLTPEEFASLSQMNGPNRMRIKHGSRAHELMFQLQAQGRVYYVLGDATSPGCAGRWHITPAGREALRLYPLMLALAEAA